MIFKITTRHAVCAAVYLVEHGRDKIVTAEEIAVNRGIPASYLPRILGKMAKAGVITSFHGGREKGYRITRDVNTITLYEVLDLFEGWSGKGCLLRPVDDGCDCPAKNYWHAIQVHMFGPLKRITLGDLCNRNTSEGLKSIRGRLLFGDQVDR